MSHYMDYGFKFAKEKPLCAAWSNSEFQPLLAISTSHPRIIFLQEEVVVNDYEIIKGKPAISLKWHPVFLCLGIGWSRHLSSSERWATDQSQDPQCPRSIDESIPCQKIIFSPLKTQS